MKCPNCKGNGSYYSRLFGRNLECAMCNGSGFVEAKKPQTNEEWFCNLQTEEKARFFSHEMRCEFCPNQEQCDSLGANCKVLWELWLKQPHREEKHNGNT